ncbi:MAG: hypothetical protein JO296_02460 [Pseudonocardiales bacterium]|nr:hypothetical protein [Pseudonocardiales bacterium]
MVVGLLWMGGILIAMGWFAIGWIARGQENRKYAESRLRRLADRAMEDQWDLIEARARWDAERVPRDSPTVVNVYLAPPDVPAPRPWVIDGEIVPSVPAQPRKAIEPRPRHGELADVRARRSPRP